jgi:hypothetical protein
LLELVAGADLQLAEHLAQVEFDRARAEEQLSGDLWVGEAASPQSLWPTLVASASRSSAPAGSRVCPVLLAASISSGSAHMD